MNLFKELIKKEFYHIIRDPRTLLIIFILPIIQILLFGYVITNEVKNAKVAIYDKSYDNVTRKLKSRIFATDYLQYSGIIRSSEEIEEKFKKGEIKEVIVFGEKFSEKLHRENQADIQIIVDASNPNTGRIISNSTQAIIQNYVKEINQNAELPFRVNIIPSMLYNPELKSAFMFVPGVMALLLTLISALMTSIAITREKETGTMEMLLVSPFRGGHIIAGKVIAYALLSMINAGGILVLANLVFELPVNGSLILLLLECLLFVVTALSLGILISTITDKQRTAMMVSSVGLLMPTMLLSGFIFPIDNMPRIIQLLTNIVPAKWFIIIIKSIMFKGTGIQYYWMETLILIVMTTLFIIMSIRNFKDRLE